MVYLLHFDKPISPNHTCQHYIGYADDIAARIQQHAHGNGARLVQVAKGRGVGFQVVRLWQGDRQFERYLKNRKGAPGLCHICNPGNRRAMQGAIPASEIESYLIPF